jgi:hypothetical protein
MPEPSEEPAGHGRIARFVVLSMPRTGSTMLTQWLCTHKDVRCLPAIFSEAGWPRQEVHGDGVFAWIRRNIDPEWDDVARRLARPQRLIRHIIARSPDKTAIGFKHHLDESPVNDFLLGSGLRKIILTRNNLLAAYSSHKVAASTGQGSARPGHTILRTLVTFDPREFARFIARRNRLYEYAREKSQNRCMEIDYTVVRTESGIAGIGPFLGVDSTGFGPQKTAKRNSDDIVSRFANPELVRRYLTDNGLAHWASES